MDDRLLVRIYNVGLGDCIYLRVPDDQDHVHILIDCGNKFSELELLGQRIAELKNELPDAGAGKKRLDLLVVTHPHEDHHKGFEEEFFQDIKIERIWLSPAFDRLNPKAQGFHALQDAAMRALVSLSGEALGDLKELTDELLSLSKAEAIDMLTTALPEALGIEAQYVSADTPAEELQIFQDPSTKLKVLGPMENIDAYYLGGDGLMNTSSEISSQGLVDGYNEFFQPSEAVEILPPKNISPQDFNRLRSRIHANALALASLAGHAANNLSVVLLLDWKGHRLLFPGDAEWKSAFKGEVKAGKTNGSWNVMWQERNAELIQALDFLKIGHHGSKNATPWTSKKSKGKVHPINDILDHLLPLPPDNQAPTAIAVASTERTNRWPSIPDPELAEEIGRRVANAVTDYVEDPKRIHVPDNTPQPQRTDLEAQVTQTPETPVPCIDITFAPLSG